MKIIAPLFRLHRAFNLASQVGTPQSTFLLSGGTLNKWNSAGGTTIIGDNRVSIGSMIISNNATFNSFGGNIYVGIGTGIGELLIYSGLLHKSANDFLVGTDNGSRGTVKIYGGVISNSVANVVIGVNAGSIGELTITNGLFFAQNELDLGRWSTTSKGTMNITNGTVVSGPFVIGWQGIGTVNQTGGAVKRSTNGNEWWIGAEAGGVGVLNISGGTFDTAGSNWQIGRYGRGTVNQNGGEVSSGQWPVIGRYVLGYGEYNLSGGIFRQTGTGNRLIVGESGRGILTVSGAGYADLYGGLSIGHANDGTGTVHLVTGGTIATPIIAKPNNTRTQATFNFNGGTLLVRNSGATIANFLQGLDAANVLAGGAIIDSSNNTVTVAQNLVTGATPDGGLTKKGTGTLYLTGTNTWKGTTRVQNGILSFAGASSLPASTVFSLEGGTLDLYGRTYTTNTFAMTGGLVNGTFNANELTVSGNSEVRVKLPTTTLLTKNDAGTAVLAGDSDFSGDIALNQGTLKIQALLAPPPILTNSLAWFDADDLSVRTTDANGKVAAWVNKGKAGSLGDAVQVTAGVGPVLKPNALNGRTVFSVPGTTSMITTNTTGISGAVDRTLFTVGCRGNGSMFLAHIGNGANNNAFGISSEALNSFWYTWGADITFGTQPVGVYEMMDFMLESKNGTATLYSNTGTTTKNQAFPNVNTVNTALGLGSRLGGTSLGELGEVILFNRALSAGERTTVQDYLKAKWFGVNTAAMMATTTVDVVTLAASTELNLDGGTVAMTSLAGSGLVTNGQALVSGDVAPGGIGSLNTLTIAGTPTLTGTLRIDVATDGTSDLLKVQGALNLADLALQIDNTSSLRASKVYTIATFTPGQLIGMFESTNLAGTGMGVVYDNGAGEIRLVSVGTMILFL
jgi:autotransporter-associated beta strand protein